MASPQKAPRKPQAQSRITNGKEVLPGVDMRSRWIRRMRDVMDQLIASRGGADQLDVAEQLVIRRAAVLEAELTYMEARFAKAYIPDADSGPSRTPIPTHRGQRSGDRGQFLTMVQA